MEKIYIYTDGGSRGNPGQAAIGVFIKNDFKILAKIGKRIGETTNNVAEYSAVLAALTWVMENKKLIGNSEINFYMDSQLIYSQITGLYKIKNENLRKLHFEVKKKGAGIKNPIYYNSISREQNKEADKLVNQALDNILL